MSSGLVFIVEHIQVKKPPLIEGELRCKDLKDHLVKINASNTVFLSEDGSGIVRRVVYDSKTNQLVGLVLPLENGMPKQFTYLATSKDRITQFMEQPKSSYVYLITAQPLKKMLHRLSFNYMARIINSKRKMFYSDGIL